MVFAILESSRALGMVIFTLGQLAQLSLKYFEGAKANLSSFSQLTKMRLSTVKKENSFFIGIGLNEFTKVMLHCIHQKITIHLY